jgi:hypothetical protein
MADNGVSGTHGQHRADLPIRPTFLDGWDRAARGARASPGGISVIIRRWVLDMPYVIAKPLSEAN